ncbi:hypothetical protein J437_LFUL018134 [Ladona fulva]|uniref:Uncharacterized protein n=1 Tax=Ladona fulva TaxID=123851 RepID=A0A8K0NY14_LADFU|nr:hypothetical protein J437_LFUL018134 [Ladona fulva]
MLLVSSRSERSREEVVLEAGSGRGSVGESAWLFVSLAERCMVHCAFSQDMKQRLTSWKLQVEKSCRPLIPPRQAPRPNSSSSSVTCCTTVSTSSSAMPCELRHLNTRSKWNHQFSTLHSDFPVAVGGCRPRFCQRSCSNGAKTPFSLLSKAGTPSQHLMSAAPQLQLATSSASNSSSSSSPSSSSPLPSATRLVNAIISEVGPQGSHQQLTASSAFLSKRPSLQDSLLTEPSSLNHASLHRTKSAPPKPNYFCAGSKVEEKSCVGFGLASLGGSLAGHDSPSVGPTDPEINSRLESLCLSMTEHALGGVGGI